jgi:YHYH protein
MIGVMTADFDTDDEIDDTGERPRLNRRAFLGVLGATGAGLAAGAVVGGLGKSLFTKTSSATTTEMAAPTQSAAPSTGSTTTGDLQNFVEITTEGGERVIRSNGIPQHPLDPGFDYMFGVSEQSYEFRVPTEPTRAGELTEVRTGQKFGVSIDGVPFDPSTAGFWNGDPSSGWLQDAHLFPLDVYGAHVQPGGVYHRHEYPTEWDLVASNVGSEHGALVGWAADGYPVYPRYGYRERNNAKSGVTELRSSWRMKSGTRPSDSPGGSYDGTWVQDYEYVEGLGVLDQCNGRECVTPEFPNGTYAYFLTTEWPFVPRWIRGEVSDSFAPGPGGPPT